VSRQDDRPSARVAILWMAVLFIAVALVGHLLVPAVDLVWIVVGMFGVLAVGQAFLFDRPSRPGQER
jgi:hypothetical protein